jgi:dethiobiotin synthetase
VRIRRQGSSRVPYEQVNPFVYEPPIAPHLAALQAGERIDPRRIAGCLDALSVRADWVLVEGVGGWQVPLDEQWTVADLARRLTLPVILVVGLKLGCINHALLSAESILASGVELAGWVANLSDGAMLVREANIETLRQRIDAPLLGVVPRLQPVDPGGIAACLDLTPAIGR